MSQDQTADLTAWVRSNCAVVPPETWESPNANDTAQPGRPVARGQQLYDCGAVGAAPGEVSP
jgi:hypothetical protein